MHELEAELSALTPRRRFITKFLLCVSMLVSLVVVSHAADSDWQPVATDLLQREKTGFGGLCGVVVDHSNGDLCANLSDRGMFHSADQGQTWKRASDSQPKGRTETPGCWLLDPTGKSQRMVTARVYGSPISVSADRAATWKSWEGKSSHSDWCAVDWTDPESPQSPRKSGATGSTRNKPVALPKWKRQIVLKVKALRANAVCSKQTSAGRAADDARFGPDFETTSGSVWNVS